MAARAFAPRVVEGGNPSGIYPTEFKVLVRPIPVDEKTKGGIIRIEETREREKFAVQDGWLVAVSPVAFTYADWPVPTNIPKPGQKVVFTKYAGSARVGKDGVDYRLINDKDVHAVIDD